MTGNLFYLPEAAIDVIKIFSLGTLSFLLAFGLTSFLTKILYKHQLWRKTVRTQAIDGKDLTYFQKFHSEGETHVPRFGGLLIWLVPSFLAVFFYLIHKTGVDIWWLQKLNFLNRGQTWLPFFALVSAALVGFLDDFLQVIGRGKYIAKGLTLKQRIILMGLIGAVGAWWFYAKLESSSLHVPGIGDFEIGIWYLPLFIVVMMATYSGGVIDGLDGLAGGCRDFRGVRGHCLVFRTGQPRCFLRRDFRGVTRFFVVQHSARPFLYGRNRHDGADRRFDRGGLFNRLGPGFADYRISAGSRIRLGHFTIAFQKIPAQEIVSGGSHPPPF